LKSVRNSYAAPVATVVTSAAACCLLLQAAAVWRGWPWADGSTVARHWFAVLSLCSVATAAGVIWVGWYLAKVSRAITSAADRLRSGTPSQLKLIRNGLVGQLASALETALEHQHRYTAELETQVKELKIQIQISQRRERNTEAIIYSIRDAVIVVDESAKVLMANEAAGRLFGFDYRDCQYKRIEELIDADKSEFVDFLRQCRQSKARATRRQIELAGHEQTRTFDTIVSCVYDDSENVCGLVAVFHDVTREKEISQMKNDFVSHVSHELKTPLASITAYSEMLLDGEANDEKTRKEFYEVIQSQANRLNRLIEDILNVSRIESGLMKVEKKPLSLVILIEEQLRMIKSYADEKNITIVEPQNENAIVFGQVYADKDMISQVIVNLLSNAIKYTPSGGSVKIETEVDENAGLARVSVTDTGVGIPEDQLDYVFDKFYRVSANKNQAKGTGLGLNLVKQIVEKMHNGRVFVTSKVGQGSTFGFELPLATAEMARISP